MADNVATARQLYLQGNEYRRRGLWHEAINCYTAAMENDPDSPAGAARAMLEEILNYRCNDYYNP